MINVYFTPSVGGVRLANKPLHFGHYVGTFLAHSVSNKAGDLVYIIKDTEPYIWPDMTFKRKCVVDVARAAMSLAGGRCTVVMASTLQQYFGVFYSVMLDITNVNSIVGAHFKKKAIREGSYSESVKNFVFPIDEATVLTFLQAEAFFSNMDNERIIRFTRDCQKKLYNLIDKSTSLSRTEIISYPGLRFLPGFDYKRMATNNGNILSVNSTCNETINYCRESAKIGRYFKSRPDKLAEWKSYGKISIDNDYIPFIIMRLLADDFNAEEFNLLRRGSENLARFEQLYFSTVMRKVSEWRALRESNTLDDGELYDQLCEDGHRLGLRFQSMWARLL